MSAILAQLAVAVENEDLLVRKLQLAHDSYRIELSVQDDYHAGFAILLASQLLASILEGGALRVLAYLKIAVSFDGDFTGLFAFLVVCAANKSRILNTFIFLFVTHYIIPLRCFILNFNLSSIFFVKLCLEKE